MRKGKKKQYEEEYVLLGAVIIGETSAAWRVKMGMDTLHIPKSCSRLRKDECSIKVAESFLEERIIGLDRGIFRNRGKKSNWRDED